MGKSENNFQESTISSYYVGPEVNTNDIFISFISFIYMDSNIFIVHKKHYNPMK